ncbi:MAG: CaiB/BaiF CoA-transferase family protein [Stappiaceae bacterium]
MGPLSGLRVLDLSRILAGPTATQLLGDLGAEIIKIERPVRGDDTRGWGPPFLKDKHGSNTRESAYYLSSNRNKSSVAVNLASPEGQALIRALATKSDILVENFKVGDLKRYGLDYHSLRDDNPGLIYCSITGFGQTGPYSNRAGYDFLIQGMGGLMSITGDPDEDGGRPMKAGVGIADVMCGMYACNAILAALNARHASAKGQYIDISLLDCQVAWLINQGVAHLVSGETPKRLGNGHPTIVPYETFPASDKDFIIATGNDDQFQRLCVLLGDPSLPNDPRFTKNADRVGNRDTLLPLLRAMTMKKTASEWIDLLEEAGVPGGPVNTITQVFQDPHILHRGMKLSMPHALTEDGSVSLIGNPINMSETPVHYRKAPPRLGEHTSEILSGVLGLEQDEIENLAATGVIALGAET